MTLDFDDLPPLTEVCDRDGYDHSGCPACKGTGYMPTAFGAAVLDLVRTHAVAEVPPPDAPRDDPHASVILSEVAAGLPPHDKMRRGLRAVIQNLDGEKRRGAPGGRATLADLLALSYWDVEVMRNMGPAHLRGVLDYLAGKGLRLRDEPPR